MSTGRAFELWVSGFAVGCSLFLILRGDYAYALGEIGFALLIGIPWREWDERWRERKAEREEWKALQEEIHRRANKKTVERMHAAVRLHHHGGERLTLVRNEDDGSN